MPEGRWMKKPGHGLPLGWSWVADAGAGRCMVFRREVCEIFEN